MLKWLAVVAASLAVVAIVGGVSLAEEKKEEKEKKTRVTGTVVVTKDDKGEITGVSIKVSEEKTQKLVLDDKAKEVAKLEGKKVRVVGTLDKDGNLVVESYKEVKEEKKEEPKKE